MPESLRKHAVKEINFFRNEIINKQTDKQQKSYKNAKSCYTCTEKFEDKYTKAEKYCKFQALRMLFHIEAAKFFKKRKRRLQGRLK